MKSQTKGDVVIVKGKEVRVWDCKQDEKLPIVYIVRQHSLCEKGGELELSGGIVCGVFGSLEKAKLYIEKHNFNVYEETIDMYDGEERFSRWYDIDEYNIEVDPTRMSPRDELRAKVLRVLSEMFLTTAGAYMSRKDKYETITDLYMPKLMDICMED